MNIIKMKGSTNLYTCNAYLVLGTWNSLCDVNTVVDIGTDGSIIGAIEETSTGVGKRPVEKVVLTHNHFDHTGGLPTVKKKFKPEVCAFAQFEGVDTVLRDGQIIKLGDREFEVIHAPGHSDDSICLYCVDGGVLFSGDTPLKILSREGKYSRAFERFLERIAEKKIDVIYSGHDDPLKENIPKMLSLTMHNVKSHQQSFTLL